MFTFFQTPYGRHLGFSKGRLFFLKSGNISAYKHHRHLILVSYAQYTPPTKIWKLNMFRIYPVELSCVGGVYAPVDCRDPLYNSAAYMWLSQKIGNWVTTDDWYVHNHTADTTQLDFVVGKLFRLVETRRDCRQLVANSINTADATQLDSWVASASAVCIGLNSNATTLSFQLKTLR